MNTKQDLDDEKIAATLAAADWMPLKESRKGYPGPSLSMHYHNGTFDVGISRWESLALGQFLFEATEGYLKQGLTAEEANTYSGVPTGQMYIEYRDKLDAILQAIIEFAKQVNYDNMGIVLKPILVAAAGAYRDEYTAGRQGEPGEHFTAAIDPATWYPKMRH
ncbi:MAG: hypothetical protein JWL85_184 [Candidatus Saccharibacteria bacterium]|nr:hypothetical protein [Candidatus Saccharibacteria bacterium]